MLAKRFAGADGLWFFDDTKPTIPVRRRNPDRIFCERGFNRITVFGGQSHDQAEYYFGRVESETAPILDYLVESLHRQQIPKLDQRQRFALSVFVFQLRKRPPEARERMKREAQLPTSFDDYVLEYEQTTGLKASQQEIELLRTSGSMERILHNSTVVAGVEVRGKIELAVANAGLHFGIATGGSSFAIGSNPVLRIGGELGGPNAAIILPIAHDVVLYFGDRSLEGQVFELRSDVVRKMNDRAWGQSRSIAGSSQAMISSLVRRAIARSRVTRP